MSSQSELNLAKEDEEVAQFLFESRKSVKWVVIASFYSALHLLRSKLFPYTVAVGGKSTTYQTCDDFYADMDRAARPSQHRVIMDLAWKELPDVAAKYQWLFDQSTTARYSNYSFDNRAGKMALNHLKEIRKHCA